MIDYTKNNYSKVYDCFTFFNEFELLEIRLNLLNEVVDKFVLVEATKTYQGKEKPLFYNENKDKFAKFQDKIIHIIVDYPSDDILDLFNIYYSLNEGLTSFQNLTESLALKALSSFSSSFLEKISSNNKVERLAWKREHYQRNMIMDGLNCNPDDVVIISDLDEIPKPQKILTYKDRPGIKIFKQKLYIFYLNYENRVNINSTCNGAAGLWNGSIMTHYKYITLPQALRILIHMPPYPVPSKFNFIHFIENGGWHFSSLGGIENFKNKINSFAHIELNNKAEDIYKSQERGILYYDNSQLVCVPIDESFPVYVRNNIDRFSHLICKNYY